MCVLLTGMLCRMHSYCCSASLESLRHNESHSANLFFEKELDYCNLQMITKNSGEKIMNMFSAQEKGNCLLKWPFN